jgi:hypothetical protein
MMLFVLSNLGTGFGLMMVNKALVKAPLAMRAALGVGCG